MNKSLKKHDMMRVHAKTKSKIKAYANRRRLNIVDVAEAAFDAFSALPQDQQQALIERRPVRSAVA